MVNKSRMDLGKSPPMDRRPSDGLEVGDEDLNGLRHKSSDGLEAKLVIGWPWRTWRGGSAMVV